MALRIPNLGTGNGSTGDNELKIRQDYNHNFSDQTNAASHLVGTGFDQIPLAQDAFKATFTKIATSAQGASFNADNFESGTRRTVQSGVTLNAPTGYGTAYGSYWCIDTMALEDGVNFRQIAYSVTGNQTVQRQKFDGAWSQWQSLGASHLNYSQTSTEAANTVVTPSGELKKATQTYKSFGVGTNIAAQNNPERLGGFSSFLTNTGTSPENCPSFQMAANFIWADGSNAGQILMGLIGERTIGFRHWNHSAQDWERYRKIYHEGNVTKDANGFLKSASPVVDLYDNRIELNYDAAEQGGVTFEKLGIGDYLVKGSLGFAQEGWYIETPKDANGNVLVAVVYKQLANNDISIKTYAKKFDDETGDIVANLLKPRDIPIGRFISLRLHELPKEPPVMPTEPQPEI